MIPRALNREALLAGADGPDRALRATALDLIEEALAAIEPERAVRRALLDAGLAPAVDGCHVFGFGKAALGMARGLLALGRPRGGLLVGPTDEASTLGPLDLRPGGHPLPRPDAPETAEEMLNRARRLGPLDTAICLVSGGGSAMLEAPMEGLTLRELRRCHEALIASGAAITEVNAVRAALSRVKGGGLLEALGSARVINVVISDVVGGPLSAVASGPTFPAPPGADPVELLRRRRLEDLLPPALLDRLSSRPPRPTAVAPTSLLAADNETALRALRDAAASRGLVLRALPPLSGEARDYAATLPLDRSGAAGGETTVSLGARPGRGGRNQELLLAAFSRLDASAGRDPGLLLTLGTDGIDGASESAGALLDRSALRVSEREGLDPRAALAAHDSGTFFSSLGTAIRTGPTGTNVADLLLRLRPFA